MNTPTLKELSSGKTKTVYEHPVGEHLVILRINDQLTAGDGARSETMIGKGLLSTATNCHVFNLLNASRIPTAFVAREEPDSFRALKCNMLPFEVVTRGYAAGSYKKRHPHAKKYEPLGSVHTEFYLKTTGRKWGDIELPCDDPLLDIASNKLFLRDPKIPLKDKKGVICELADPPQGWNMRLNMTNVAKSVYDILHERFQNLRCKLIDMKIEFGTAFGTGKLVVADTITNDEWRLLDSEGSDISKQMFRDGKPLDDILSAYRRVVKLTASFE